MKDSALAEAYNKIERKFSSGNGTEVDRVTITKEEWEFAKEYIALMGLEKRI